MSTWLRYAGRPLKPALGLLRSYVTAPMAAELERLSARLDHVEQPAPIAAVAPVPSPAAPIDMSLLLHRGRTALLREVPKGAATFLSAGCSGAWFFEWVEQCYGAIPRHIGLEYYTPRPGSLPANVDWIANTCSDMSGIADSSCDLVFSGQNIEHLWPDETVGFLLEAARVTRPGRLLVMDSPNRAITEALGHWSHPEHTVELTTAEAIALTQLAGFDIAAVKGIWLGRDPATGTVLPFQFADGQAMSLEERLVGGVGQPDHAFLWWIEARRAAREPDGPALRRRVAAIFEVAWPGRVSRTVAGVGQVERRPDGDWVVCPSGTPGPLIYGPYMPLRAGRYRCTFYLEGNPDARGHCDAVWGEQGHAIASRALDPGPARQAISLDFELPELRFGVQFRCFSAGGGGFACRRVVDLDGG